MIFDAGGGNNLWQDYDVNTGTLIGTQGTAGTAVAKGSGIIAYPNGWYRCWQAMTLVSTAAGVSMTIYADNGGGTYSYAGNSSAALYLWGAQLDGGDAFDTCPRSYPANSIAGVAGGRGVDALTYVFASNASATAGTAYAEVKTQWSSSLGTYPVVAFSTSPNFPLYAISGDAATTIRTNDGTTSVQKTGISSMKTAVRKVASSWTGSVLAVTGGGAAAASGTFDGNMGSTAIGIGQPTTYTGVNWSGNIRNLKLYTTAATAAELTGLTT